MDGTSDSDDSTNMGEMDENELADILDEAHLNQTTNNEPQQQEEEDNNEEEQPQNDHEFQNDEEEI
eukprot:3599690-Ditylum_brightwellii.AAC.1